MNHHRAGSSSSSKLVLLAYTLLLQHEFCLRDSNVCSVINRRLLTIPNCQTSQCGQAFYVLWRSHVQPGAVCIKALSKASNARGNPANRHRLLSVPRPEFAPQELSCLRSDKCCAAVFHWLFHRWASASESSLSGDWLQTAATCTNEVHNT